MKTQTYNSLGLDVPFSVPESVEEFDLNAKKAGACLSEAINNCIYRGSLATFRDVFLHGQDEEKNDKGEVTQKKITGVDDLSGIQRKTKVTMKDGKPVIRDGNEVTSWDETEGDFFKRVCATQGVEPAAFQELANEVAAAIVFDASASERKPVGPKKLPKIYRDTAEAVLKNKDKNWPKFTAALQAEGVTVPTLTEDAAKDVELVGWAIKESKERKNKREMAELVEA